MSVMELELQKASLAREILSTSNEVLVNNMWLLLKKISPFVYQSEMPTRRKIGIFDGKNKVVFRDNWSITTEELLDLK